MMRQRLLGQGGNIDLIVEVARIGHDTAIFHRFEVLAVDHVQVAGHSNDDVGLGDCIRQRHDSIAIHQGLERAGRIDFGHDHVRTHAMSARSKPTTAPAIAAHHEGSSREQNVCRPNQAVERALTGSITVIKHVFGERFVHRHDRKT